MAGGKSTGNAAGGNILLQVSQTGDSGTALNTTLETAVTASGSDKSMTCAGDIVIPMANGKLGCAADTDLINLANVL